MRGKRGELTVVIWGERLGHHFHIYFVRRFVLFDVSCGDSELVGELGATVGNVFKTSNDVNRQRRNTGILHCVQDDDVTA
jgi:hypothetical protein